MSLCLKEESLYCNSLFINLVKAWEGKVRLNVDDKCFLKDPGLLEDWEQPYFPVFLVALYFVGLQMDYSDIKI